MFGRKTAEADQPAAKETPKPKAAPSVAAPKPAAPAGANAARKPAGPSAPPRIPQAAAKVQAIEIGGRSDEYFQTKTTIFNALIDTIDLSQLAQLDAKSAAEEIRDIVNE
ncbi:MAG TPA: protein kinase, partial [Parvularcula sp.]|nr:protein kinase [Parvularcula sp.]